MILNKEIKPTAVVVSPLATRSGYGDHSYDLCRSLLRYNKFDNKFISLRWGACPMNQLVSPKDDDIISRILTAPLTEQPHVNFHVSIPSEFQPIGKYNIGITAGMESTVCRGEWIEGLNRMQLCIVPSVHAKRVFENTVLIKQEPNGRREEIKARIPIEVLFEGADTDVFKKTKDIPKSISNHLDGIPEDFAFLFVGHWLQGEIGHDRKNVGMTIKTFLEVFKNVKKKPALILKTSGATLSVMDRTEISKKIYEICASVHGDIPNVYLVHGDLSREEINGLYNHPKVKAHINLTLAEGFGRPILEATLSGKPSIVSGWSGQLDFLNPAYANLIPGEIKPVHPSAVNEWIIKESSWFYPNLSAAAGMMEDVFKNYNKYLPNAEKLRNENEKKFSLKAMDTKFVEILEKYVPQFEKQVEINLPVLKKFKMPEIPSNIQSMELPTLKKSTL
jgi:glycosyltransferase involved in cell wall biosynthesis